MFNVGVPKNIRRDITKNRTEQNIASSRLSLKVFSQLLRSFILLKDTNFGIKGQILSLNISYKLIVCFRYLKLSLELLFF